MKYGQAGFMFIEVMVAMSIIALVAAATTMSIFQMASTTDRSNGYMTAVRQVQNAGYWISQDAQMAESVSTDNLTPPNILVLKWTDWGYDTDSVYHSVTYSLENVSDGIGELKRTHQDSEGANEQMLVAQDIYYDPSDPDNATQASYEGRVLTVKLVAMSGGTEEVREYKVYTRPEF